MALKLELKKHSKLTFATFFQTGVKSEVVDKILG